MNISFVLLFYPTVVQGHIIIWSHSPFKHHIERAKSQDSEINIYQAKLLYRRVRTRTFQSSSFHSCIFPSNF